MYKTQIDNSTNNSDTKPTINATDDDHDENTQIKWNKNRWLVLVMFAFLYGFQLFCVHRKMFHINHTLFCQWLKMLPFIPLLTLLFCTLLFCSEEKAICQWWRHKHIRFCIIFVRCCRREKSKHFWGTFFVIPILAFRHLAWNCFNRVFLFELSHWSIVWPCFSSNKMIWVMRLHHLT